MSESREYTTEEVREQFLNHVRAIASYWSRQGGSDLDRCEGVAFSILVLLDGGTGFPGSSVIPQPHPEDKQYHQENEENWYPDECDISGGLHEHFYKQI